MNNNSQSVNKNATQPQSALSASAKCPTQPCACPAPSSLRTQLYPEQPGFTPNERVAVGSVILAADNLEYNCFRQSVTLKVRNTGDRPIQVGSHFHFFEVNRYLEFDRDAAFGMHLNIPATTAVRFEPGDEKQVELVASSGKRRVVGFNGLVMGYTGVEDKPTYYPAHTHALRAMHHAGFKCSSPACAPKCDCNDKSAPKAEDSTTK